MKLPIVTGAVLAVFVVLGFEPAAAQGDRPLRERDRAAPASPSGASAPGDGDRTPTAASASTGSASSTESDGSELARGATPVSLREVLLAARTDVATVRLAEAARERLESQRSYAVGSYLPVLSAQGTAGWAYDNRLIVPELPRIDSKSLSAQGTVSLDWTLVNLARGATVGAATDAIRAGKHASENAKRQAELAAIEFYVSAAAATELVEDARLTLERRTNQYEAIRGLVNAGLRQPIDAQRAEIEAVSARYVLAMRQRDELGAFSLLGAAMGRNPGTRVRPQGLSHEAFDVPISPERAAALALANRPEIKRDRMLSESRKGEHDAAVLSRLPVLGVAGTGSISYLDVLTGQGIDGYQYGGSALAYLKWSGLDPATWLKGPVTEAVAAESDRQVQVTLQIVGTEAVQAAYAVQSMRIARERALAVLDVAKATREAQNGRYRTGLGSLLELLDAEAVEQQARQRRIEAERDLDIAGARLLAACGLLERLAR